MGGVNKLQLFNIFVIDFIKKVKISSRNEVYAAEDESNRKALKFILQWRELFVNKMTKKPFIFYC